MERQLLNSHLLPEPKNPVSVLSAYLFDNNPQNRRKSKPLLFRRGAFRHLDDIGRSNPLEERIPDFRRRYS